MSRRIARLAIAMAFLSPGCMAHAQTPLTADEPAKAALRTRNLTELDRYVAEPDEAFAWKVVARNRDGAATEIIIQLTSQTWRSTTEVDRNVWQHWLSIIVPNNAESDTALMIISGGSNDSPALDRAPPLPRQIALATGSVVAEVKDIPNQPLVFADDGRPRSEDDLLAYTWRKCLDSGDVRWPGQLPMTKAVVRAMDAVQAALAVEQDLPQVKRFVVAGASKRGWTTWLTAAVDPRVAAIAPMVIDVLNVGPSMKNHHAAYNGWSPALDDYVREGLTDRLGEPGTARLFGIVDPYVYRDRLTMPKCVINAAGDEFFTPDSSQFYFDDLPGEKLIAYFPNTGHGLDHSNALETLVAFYVSVMRELPRPKVTWQLTDNGQWRVHSEPAPRGRALASHKPRGAGFSLRCHRSSVHAHGCKRERRRRLHCRRARA